MRSTPNSLVPFHDGHTGGLGPAAVQAHVPALAAQRQMSAAINQHKAARAQRLAAPPPVDEAAALFRTIRQMSGLSPVNIARRLHTRTSVISALEQGDFQRLPPWPETVLVVSGYTALAGVDPRPVLAAIRDMLDAKVIDVQPSPYPNAYQAAAAQPSSRTSPVTRPDIRPRNAVPKALMRKVAEAEARGSAANSEPQRFGQARSALGASVSRATAVTQSALQSAHAMSRRLGPFAPRLGKLGAFARVAPPWRMPVTLSLAITLPLALLVSFGSGGTLLAAVSGLPQPISGAIRKVEDFVLRRISTEQNGLVWIDVSDPRSRKTDKLPAPRR